MNYPYDLIGTTERMEVRTKAGTKSYLTYSI